jgi:hypothetical protein
MAAHHSPRNKRDCAAAGVCAKEIKPELNTLDEADFVRDVDNRVAVEKTRFFLTKPILGDRNSAKSFIELPDAKEFLRNRSERVFQQPLLLSPPI